MSRDTGARRRRVGRRRIASAALAIGLALAACAGPTTEAPSTSDPALTPLTVGTLPIIDAAPIHLAIEGGYFADEGLEVTVELVQGGAAAIPALVAGDLDVAYGAWPSFLLANAQGFELVAVADGTRARPGFTELLTMPGSGLEGDPSQLAGRRIAVNTLGNIGELAVRSALVRAGLDPDAAQLIEVPFPEMTAALERGDVDAIWASEPVATLARETIGAVLVTDSYVEEMEAFPVAGYQATAEFVGANPDTVAAFRRAMERAVERIAAEPEVVLEIAPGFTNLEPDLLSRVAMPEFRAALDPDDLRRVHDRMREFGMLEASLDLDALVHPDD